MTLKELEKILNICYTRHVTAQKKRGGRIVVEERAVTNVEIAEMIAHEFGFILKEDDKK